MEYDVIYESRRCQKPSLPLVILSIQQFALKLKHEVSHFFQHFRLLTRRKDVKELGKGKNKIGM
jgi:hypothetical protein